MRAQGSTAIQVVSALAPHVASLANYVRGQTWLAPPFSMDMVKDLLGREQTAAEDDRKFALSAELLHGCSADPLCHGQ